MTLRAGYLGPEGTFSSEALMASPDAAQLEPIPLPSVYEAVMAVQDGHVDRSLVPIESSLEGAVSVTLDTLALEARDVRMVGELVHPVHHSLVAAALVELDELATVISHPHALAQCSRLLRGELAHASTLPASSTAEAVRRAVAEGAGCAAIGTRHAARRYGGHVLRGHIEDVAGNETRFVWLAPAGTAPGGAEPWKTSVVFWGVGADASGWLVSCLSEFAFRGVNLTRIESRPRRQGLGSYMFFVDLEGAECDPPVAGALKALRTRTDELRMLGSYPAAR